MADNQAPQPLESLTTLTLQSSNQNARKLRDSCTGCASSKLKCSKEKPTCTRCSKRGIACEYAASRRTGRTSHSTASKISSTSSTAGTTRQSMNTTTSERHDFQDAFWSPPSYTPALTPRSTPNNTANTHRPRREHPTHSNSDIWCTMLSPGGSSGEAIISPRMPMDADFDLFESILDNTDIELPASQGSSSSVLASHPMYSFGGSMDSDNGQFTSQDYAAASDMLDFDSMLNNTDMGASSQPPTDGAPDLDTLGRMLIPDQDQLPSLELSLASGSSGPDAAPISEARAPRRCCLTMALEFLTQLFPNAPTACTLPGSQAGVCHLPTIESVIAKNRQITEAIGNMLDCPCLQDEYVVAIISLIVFKVMAWYAAAAGDRTPTDDGMSWSGYFAAHHPEQPRQGSSSFGEQVVHLPTTIGNYCIDGNDQSRMAAQLVLSELHRVQRLVNLLSKRLGDIRLRNGGASSSGSGSGSSSVADFSDIQSTRSRGASALSAPTFYQLENDLRKRLRTVSSETIDILRRE